MSKKRYFLPYELDAFNNAPTIGVACGTTAASIVYGNMLMWQHVWKTKSDLVTTAHVQAFFGVNACEALVLFNHLEASEKGWRVKGAAEWLRVMTAQSRAGKAHAKNLIPGGPTPLGSPSAPPSASAPKSAEAEAKPIGSPSALPATSDQRPATIDKPVAKKPATPADPRLHPLGLALEADFEAIRRERYKHRGAADTLGLKSLLPLADDAKIRDRWKLGLRASGWASCSTFAQLASKWNDLAAPTGPPKGSAIHGQTAWGPDDDFLTGLSGGSS